MEPIRLNDLHLAELRDLARQYDGPANSYDRAALVDYLNNYFDDVAARVRRRPA